MMGFDNPIIMVRYVCVESHCHVFCMEGYVVYLLRYWRIVCLINLIVTREFNAKCDQNVISKAYSSSQSKMHTFLVIGNIDLVMLNIAHSFTPFLGWNCSLSKSREFLTTCLFDTEPYYMLFIAP